MNTTEITEKACATLVDDFEARDFPHADWQFLATAEGTALLFGFAGYTRDMDQANDIAARYTEFLTDGESELTRITIGNPEGTFWGTIPALRITGKRDDVTVALFIPVPADTTADISQLIP